MIYAKWGLILSVPGIAVGTGNIWRLPYYLLESILFTLSTGCEQADAVWTGFQSSLMHSIFHAVMIIFDRRLFAIPGCNR